MENPNGHGPEAHAHGHAHPRYILIYGTLLVLLVASILGPMVGIKAVILVSAFGIAAVKAAMVCAYFMHLKFEKRYVWWILLTCVLFLVVLFVGVAPDVMKGDGLNWTNPGLESPVPPPPPAEHGH